MDLRESPTLSTMIRESPTKQSLGRTYVSLDQGGQYRISSFFDIFTELSIDGGQTWVASGTPDIPLHLSGNGSPVPEPSTLVLLGIGAISLLAHALRRRRQAA
jgi:hypothetical protein